MVFSGLIFCAKPRVAEAASAGSYYVKLTLVVNKKNNLNGTYGGFNKESNDSGGVSLLYRDTNGTGSTDKEQKWDIGNKSLNYCTSTGTKYLTATISGFPRLIYVYCDDNAFGFSDTVQYKITKLEVGSSSSNLTTVWEGQVQAGSINNPYAASVDWSYTHKADYFGSSGSTNASTSNKSWTRPYASNMTASFKSGTVNCPKTSSASDVTNTLSYGATDQYGVTMASSLCDVSVASDQASNQVNGSNKVSITNNHTGSDTVSAPYAANLKGATNSQTITATCSWKGSSAKSTTAKFTLNDARYTPTFKYYTTNESSDSGTANTVSGTATYFGVVPTVPTAASAVTEYHTNARHYTDGHYNLPAEGTGIKTDATYTMVYTSAVHAYGEPAVITAPTCTEKGMSTFTCTGCTYSYDVETDALGHQLSGLKIGGNPENAADGYMYYECERCAEMYSVDVDESGNSVPGAPTTEENVKSESAIPAPTFNTYEQYGYNYESRGVSLRWAEALGADQTLQATRFTASLQAPAGAQVTDFGFVYTQTRFLNGGVEPANDDNSSYGIENFTLDNVGSEYRVYQKSIYTQTDDSTKYTVHDNGGNQVYTFNLVVNVRNTNWQKHYAARAYIKYKYKGQEFTVYDNDYSSRTVYYVAQRACADESMESSSVKKYFNNKILNSIDPDAYPVI